VAAEDFRERRDDLTVAVENGEGHVSEGAGEQAVPQEEVPEEAHHRASSAVPESTVGMRYPPTPRGIWLIVFHNLLAGGFLLWTWLSSFLGPWEPPPSNQQLSYWLQSAVWLLTGGIMAAAAVSLLAPRARPAAIRLQWGVFWGQVLLVALMVVEIRTYHEGGVGGGLRMFALLLFGFWALVAFLSVMHLIALADKAPDTDTGR